MASGENRKSAGQKKTLEIDCASDLANGRIFSQKKFGKPQDLDVGLTSVTQYYVAMVQVAVLRSDYFI